MNFPDERCGHCGSENVPLCGCGSCAECCRSQCRDDCHPEDAPLP